MRPLLAYVGVFLLWSVGLSLAVALGAALHQPLLGLAASVLLAVLILEGYLLRGPRPARRRAALRLRPLLRPTLPWLALAVPTVLLAAWAMEQVWVRLVPVPPESFSPFEALVRTPAQRLALTVLAVALAPVLEEFFFRGLIQHALVRRFGRDAGIALAAALFAAMHLLPWVFPLHFFLGVAFGYAVYYSRSIWAGVVLHAANNALAVGGMGERPPSTPTLWTTGPTAEWWESVAVLLVALVVLAGVGRRLRAAGRLRAPARAG